MTEQDEMQIGNHVRIINACGLPVMAILIEILPDKRLKVRDEFGSIYYRKRDEVKNVSV
jgi:hypothetical protein